MNVDKNAKDKTCYLIDRKCSICNSKLASSGAYVWCINEGCKYNSVIDKDVERYNVKIIKLNNVINHNNKKIEWLNKDSKDCKKSIKKCEKMIKLVEKENKK